MKINKNKLDYLLLISPGLILFLILILFPIFLTVIYSFFKISFLTNQYDFIGLKNFYKLLNKKELNGYESVNNFYHLTNLEIFKKLKDL